MLLHASSEPMRGAYKIVRTSGRLTGVIAWPGRNEGARSELFTEVACIERRMYPRGDQDDFSYGSQRECGQGSCSRSAEDGSSVQRNVPIASGSREGAGWD